MNASTYAHRCVHITRSVLRLRNHMCYLESYFTDYITAINVGCERSARAQREHRRQPQ